MNAWQYRSSLIRCVDDLNSGKVIAYPTEAVWGLGCDPFNTSAIEQLLMLKSRPWQKGLILIASTIEQFDFLLDDLSPELYRRLNDSWPGHHTWLVPHHNRLSERVYGRHPTVALRVTAHPVVKTLCHRFGGPIISTSANRAGMPSATSAIAARRYFLGKRLSFAPGAVGDSPSASCIRDLISGKIIRS